MRAMPAMVVAATPCPRRVFDRRTASETDDEVAGVGTNDCARSDDPAETDDDASDGGDVVVADEVAAAELTGAADGVALGVAGEWVLVVARGLARDGVGDGVGAAGVGLASTATAHSVFGYPSMPHTSPASAPVPMRMAVAAARTSVPVAPSCT
jgi:hypothetical protein